MCAQDAAHSAQHNSQAVTVALAQLWLAKCQQDNVLLVPCVFSSSPRGWLVIVLTL
jgi:sulfur relay (sulfurtransferase) complex TusBCD TusD component (DsrE family)